MKKCLWLILLFSLMLSLFCMGGSAVAEAPSPYELAQAYLSAHPARSVLSGGELASSVYLKDALDGYGYTTKTVSLDYYDGENHHLSAHVIGEKDNHKSQTILIGCYYGGYEGENVGHGATAGLSVGALLYIANALSDYTANYNITIAFWGGMEYGDSFHVDRCGVALKSIALYINLDSLAAGKYDYLYADDVPRSQEKFFRSVISDFGANVCSAPVFKKPTSFGNGGDAYAYPHLGILGANRFFLEEGIPCVNFLSGAWSYDCGLYRYEERRDIEGTTADTLAEIDRLNGGSVNTQKRLLSLSNVIIAGVKSEKLPAALSAAAKETTGADLNNRLAVYLITFIGGAILLGVFLFFILRNRGSRTESEWTQPGPKDRDQDPYEEMRSDPFMQGPFGMGREEPNEKEERKTNGEDDVFRF
ncbi:MAG TPA: hypothetical protein DIC18_03310 [Clostridiales bacterium]|nr:hypothetical protein [Clostridiales bacterium]